MGLLFLQSISRMQLNMRITERCYQYIQQQSANISNIQLAKENSIH